MHITPSSPQIEAGHYTTSLSLRRATQLNPMGTESARIAPHDSKIRACATF
jgi:hypothetical protein